MITVVGSLNYDFIMPVERFPAAGETLHALDVFGACGGKGANQAYSAAKLGAQVRMIGCVGQDMLAQNMLQNLAAVGVEIGTVKRSVEGSSGMAMILVNAHGENQIIVARGSNLRLTEQDVFAQRDLLATSKIVVAQFEVAHAVTWRALKLAHEAGAITVLTPAPYEPFDPALLEYVTYLTPNEIEASQLSSVRVTDVSSAQRAAEIIRGMGARNVLVTLGERGVWIEAQGYRGHVPAFKVNPIDTVGAGDCFTGAFAARLHADARVEDAARFGCAAAAISVTRRGAQPSVPSLDEVMALLA